MSVIWVSVHSWCSCSCGTSWYCSCGGDDDDACSRGGDDVGVGVLGGDFLVTVVMRVVCLTYCERTGERVPATIFLGELSADALLGELSADALLGELSADTLLGELSPATVFLGVLSASGSGPPAFGVAGAADLGEPNCKMTTTAPRNVRF